MIRNIFCILAVITAFSVNATILITDDDGILYGARNVEIPELGGYYNVDFLGGSCAEVFDGCNELSDFYFDNIYVGTRYLNTTFGSSVLDSYPFTDTLYDVSPELTNGCQGSIYGCRIMFPYYNSDAGQLEILYRFNKADDGADSGPYLNTNVSEYDLRNNSTRTWAVWSPYDGTEVIVAPNGGFEDDDISDWEVNGNGTVNVVETEDGGSAAQMKVTDEDAVDQAVYFSTSLITPINSFYLYFDYLFETETGLLNVLLDSELFGSYSSSEDLVGQLTSESIFIDDANLLGKKLDLTFELYPGSPASVLIDDINLSTEARPVPEPTSIWLIILCGGLYYLHHKGRTRYLQ